MRQIKVPFLVTKENIEQPIIGFNVIELIVKNAGTDVEKLVEGMTNSFRHSQSDTIPALINLIRAADTDELCLVRSTKKANFIPAGETVRLSCRANTGPIHRKHLFCLNPMSWNNGLQVWWSTKCLPQ